MIGDENDDKSGRKMTHSVRHKVLHCSYYWHRSLNVERDRFFSRLLQSRTSVSHILSGCEVVDEVGRINPFVYVNRSSERLRCPESTIGWSESGKLITE